MPIINNQHNATSIASWSLAMAEGLKTYGLDPHQIFIDTGIELSNISSPFDRLPVSSVQKVWRYIHENTDEQFGIVAASFLNIGSFHALGFGLLCSASVKELLQRLIRYRCIISHMFFAELIEGDDQVIFSTVDERRIKTTITHDTLFVYIIDLLRQACHPKVIPLEIHLDHPDPYSGDKLNQYFHAPIKFNTGLNQIIFNKAEFETPLLSSSPQLAKLQDHLVEQYISEHQLISEYMHRVKNEIRRLLESGDVSIVAIADNLQVTVRTLQRRLSDENSSYIDLLDRVRYQMAMEHIQHQNVSVTEVAYKLGFHDSGSFARNFKRWTDSSFSDYRNKHLQSLNQK